MPLIGGFNFPDALARRAVMSLERLDLAFRSVIFPDTTSAPAETGLLQRNGTGLYYYNGTSAVQLDHAPATVPTTVYKTADENVNNSNVLQNDDHLSLAIGASEVWGFQLYLFGHGDGDADFKWDFTVPASATGRHAGSIIPQSVATDDNVATAIGTSITLDIAGTIDREFSLNIWGLVVNSTNAGTLQFRWAQGTTDATDTKLYTGSFMVAHKLA